MQKRILSIFSLIILCFTTLLMTGCVLPQPNPTDKIQLSTPENLKVDPDTLSITWDPVENATKYALYFYKDNICIKSVDGQPNMVINFLDKGIYEVSVTASGDLKTTSTSKFSKRVTFEVLEGSSPEKITLPTPTNINVNYDEKLNTLVVTFKDNKEFVNAKGFQAYIYSGANLVKVYPFTKSGSSIKLDAMGDGNYTVKVSAIAGSELYNNSSVSLDSASFAVLTKGEGGNTELTGYYQNANGLTGRELEAALTQIITKSHKNELSYSQCSHYFIDTDADPSHPGNIILFYSNVSVKGTWDGGNTFNKEHVWPNSKGAGKTGPGSDLHHLRPTDKDVNSTRASYKLGIVTGGKEIIYKSFGKNIPTGCYIGNSRFEPADRIKGDVARIYMYILVRYPHMYSHLPEVAEMPDLIKWNAMDPVDSFEISRNEAVYEIQGNRNPFIDHPEFVNQIWH